MKKLLLTALCLFLALLMRAQSFTGAGGAIPASLPTPTCYPLTVSGIGNINTTTLGLESVCIRVTHPVTSELEILLQAPDGTSVPLTVQNGGSGNNYVNTCFSSTATNSVKFGSAPFSGTYLPEGYLGAVNNGQNADGTWNLCIRDRRDPSNSGNLINWNLTFGNAPAQAPPAIPGTCAATIPSAASCASAMAVCDFNGLCGKTITGTGIDDWSGAGLNSCFNLQNNTFLKFEADSTDVSFTVWVPTSTDGSTGGIQMLFFSGTCGSGAVTTYGCYPHIFPYQSGIPLSTNVKATGLTKGNVYYLMIDGQFGDQCDYIIQATSGVKFVKIDPNATAVCNGTASILTASGGNGAFNWTPSSGLNTNTGNTVIATPAVTTTYKVTTQNAVGCTLEDTATVIVNDPPAITTQPSTAPQNICQGNPVTPLTVAATAGSGVISTYQWYLTSAPNNTGGLPIPGAMGSSYTPNTLTIGTFYFYCLITNSNGCSIKTNVSGAVTINTKPAAPTGSVTVQSSCLAPTGTIVITAPAGVNIQYSLGGAYQNSGTFNGLAPGTYTATSKNIITGCVSAGTDITVSAVPPGPSTPIGSVTVQPTCAAPTGTIVITSPTGANIEYSIGGTYQASATFPGLVNGTTYNVYAKDIVTGCISAPLSLTVNTIPGAPSIPTATVTTQTDCFSATGTITITAPTGVNYEYSIGGAYQAGTSFTGIAPATNIAVTVRDISTGCVSAPRNLHTDAIIPPVAPIVSTPVTYCQNATATSLTATGTGLLWYTTSSGGIGSAAAPTPLTTSIGATTYYVSQTNGACESSRSAITVDVVTQAAAPIVTPTVTYCQNDVITSLSATGTNLLWYNTSTGGTGSSIAPTPSNTVGTTIYYVSQSLGSCESPRASVTVTVNATPAAPGVTATLTYCQNDAAATLSAIGSNLLWYSTATGGTGTAIAPTPSTIAAGNTNYYVSQTINGCESPRALITVTVNATPALPAVTAAFTYCQNDAATALTATGSNLLWYTTATGGTGTSIAPTPSTTNAGTTNYYVSQTVNGCEGPRAAITITVYPTPVLPTVNATITYCQTDVPATLTATGSNLLWYTAATGGTGTSIAPTPSTATAGTTNYYVSQTINGCEGPRAAISVTVYATPALPAVAPVVYCQNEIVPGLTATGSNLLWYNSASGGTGSAIAPTPSTLTAGVTNYWVSQTINGCEGPRAMITVTVNPTPFAPAVSNINYCRYETPGALTATGNNLLWYTVANGGTGSTTAPTPSTNSPGIQTYYVTQTELGCESPRASIAVTVKPLPLAPTVTSPVTYCQFTPSTALTATGSNLLWYTTASGGSSAATAPTPSTATPGNTFYYVSQTVNGCEGPRAGITVTINKDSTAVTYFSYNPSTVCINGTNPGPALPVGFTSGGTFSATPSGLSINSNTGDINLKLSTVGTYTITYTFPSGGCIHGGNSSTTIQIDPAIPTYTVFSYTSPVCKNAPTLLPATVSNFTTGGLYSSSPGLSINSVTGAVNVGASTPGTYQITYRLATLGCRAAASNNSYIVINDTTGAKTSFTYTASAVCITSSTNPVLIPVSGFSTGGTFSSTPAGLNINAATGTINIGLSVPGVYKIKYNVPQVLCRLAGVDSTIFTINAYGNPITGFTYFSPVCKRDGVEIPELNTGFTTGGVFSTTSGATVDAATGVVDLAKSLPGNYIVKYEVPAGECNPAGSNNVPLTIIAQPQPPVAEPASICGPGNITLNASAAGTIKWFSEQQLLNQVNVGTAFTSFVDNTTNYYVTNTVGSCASEPAAISAVVNPLPTQPFIGNDTAICPNDKIILNPGAYNSYLWQDGSTAPVYTVNTGGSYQVIVSTNAGCKDTASVTVAILGNCDDILFPSAFTPNGDGTNDWFYPLGAITVVSNYSIKIFNRYGQVVFSSSNPSDKWDGTERGKKVGNTNYVYIASYVYKNRISRTKRGNVMVIR